MTTTDRPDPERPASIRWAVRLMVAGAVLAILVGVVFGWWITDTLFWMGGDSGNSSGMGFGLMIPATLIVVVLWAWLAVGAWDAREWARTTATVLFALATPCLGYVGIIVQPGRPAFYLPCLPPGPWGFVLILAYWAVGLSVIILLWQRSSTQYCRDRKMPAAEQAVAEETVSE